MNPTDFTNGKCTMGRVLYRSIYTLKMQMCIKDKTWNVVIVTIIQKILEKCCEIW